MFLNERSCLKQVKVQIREFTTSQWPSTSSLQDQQRFVLLVLCGLLCVEGWLFYGVYFRGRTKNSRCGRQHRAHCDRVVQERLIRANSAEGCTG